MASKAFDRVYSRLQRGMMLILGALALGAAIPGAGAAAYPDRPIRLIVPSPRAAATDTSTRVIVPRMSEILNQHIVIDNRPGASGNLGAEIAAHATPDGYTLVACIASQTSNPAVMRKVPFDIVRDFAPISRTIMLPNVLVSHPSIPAKDDRGTDRIHQGPARTGAIRLGRHRLHPAFCDGTFPQHGQTENDSCPL